MAITNIKSSRAIHLIKRNHWKIVIFESICYLFILLFAYTSWSKILDFKSFSTAFEHSIILKENSLLVATLIVLIEIVIILLLIFPASKKSGLIGSLILMLLFTTYLILVHVSGNELPCGCGGLITGMSWTHHIWFNFILSGLAFAGLTLRHQFKNSRV